MSIPFKISTMGNQNARNAFKVVFSEALAQPPKLEAWDNSQTFPAKDSYGATTAKKIFTGTTGNGSIPMLYAIATTSSSPGADWKPTTATAGGATANRLKGSTNYVVNPTTPTAGSHILFNVGLKVPYDAGTTAGDMDHVLQIRYTFSGNTPSVTFYGNSGTEASPSWTQIVPNNHGIHFCDISIEGDYYLTLPESGVSDAQNIWVTSKETYSDTYTGNSNLKDTVVDSISGDASALKTLTGSIKGDASVKKTYANSYTGSSNLKETIPSSIKGDSYLAAA